MPHEFDLINQFFRPLSSIKSGEVGIGDDGAVLNLPNQNSQQMVVVSDTLIEGVHFPFNTDPYSIAWKAVAVNLSDLAAMAALPDSYTLALTLPKNNDYDEAWYQSFSLALADIQKRFNIRLVGGDTTQADKLSLTVTAYGWVNTGEAVLRSGAQAGDLILVTGLIGEGGIGLKAVTEGLSGFELAEDKLNRPVPRVQFATAVSGMLNSMIDISDGLLADLGHILEASDKGALVNLDKVPVSNAHQELKLDQLFAITCGDDFELCMTTKAENLEKLEVAADSLGLKLTVVGEVTEEKALHLLQDGKSVEVPKSLGFQHF